MYFLRDCDVYVTGKCHIFLGSVKCALGECAVRLFLSSVLYVFGKCETRSSGMRSLFLRSVDSILRQCNVRSSGVQS